MSPEIKRKRKKLIQQRENEDAIQRLKEHLSQSKFTFRPIDERLLHMKGR